MFNVIRTVIKPSAESVDFSVDANIVNLYAQVVSLLNQQPHDKFLGIEYTVISPTHRTIKYSWATEADRQAFQIANSALLNQLTNAIGDFATANGITTSVTTETI